MADLPRLFGKYEIRGEIARGGFATVYRAHDADLDREVAIKVLAPHLTWEANFAARFQQEARVSARLKHPNIVTIYEIGEVDGALFIAMELAQAGSLRDRLIEVGAQDVENTIDLLGPIAAALDFAHVNGIIHRDVKPANILLDPDENGRVRPTLTDFGLVKALASSAELTQSGAILGSVEYMAPEQADTDLADQIGPATDIYALGVVAYNMLTGQVPFSDSSAARVLVAHLTKEPPPPSSIRADLPEGVSDAILRALAKEPEDRFPTATAFVQALGDKVETEQIPAKPSVVAPPSEPPPTDLTRSEDVPTPAATEKQQAVEPESKGRSRWWWLVVPAILLALILAFVAFGTDTFHPRILALSYSPANPAPGDDIIILWRTKYAQHIDIWPMGLEYWARDGIGHIENGVAEDTELIVIASNWLGENKEALPIKVAEASAPPMNCDDAINTIADLARQDDCDAVIEKATEAITAGCSDPLLWVKQAMCHETLGQWEEALAAFTIAIEKNPSDARTFFYRSHVYKDQGQLNDALADLTTATTLEPTEAEYYLNRGDLYRTMNDLDAAAADYEQFITLTEGNDTWTQYRADRQAWLDTYAPSVEQPQDTPTPSIDTVKTSTIDGMEMVYVPAGEFIMGSSDDSGRDNEHPQHIVFLDAFWIDKTEVSNAKFAQFVADTGYSTLAEREGTGGIWVTAAHKWRWSGADWQHPNGRLTGILDLEDHPVVQISWEDAVAYCTWANRRLPTEAEWEKAARGVDGRTYPWGEDKVDGNRANFADQNSKEPDADQEINDGHQFTAPVGSYPEGASPYGLVDMTGNVMEWVADKFDSLQDDYQDISTNNPIGPENGVGHRVRGTAWLHSPGELHIARRSWARPEHRLDYLGFDVLQHHDSYDQIFGLSLHPAPTSRHLDYR